MKVEVELHLPQQVETVGDVYMAVSGCPHEIATGASLRMGVAFFGGFYKGGYPNS